MYSSDEGAAFDMISFVESYCASAVAHADYGKVMNGGSGVESGHKGYSFAENVTAVEVALEKLGADQDSGLDDEERSEGFAFCMPGMTGHEGSDMETLEGPSDVNQLLHYLSEAGSGKGAGETATATGTGEESDAAAALD